LIRFNGQKLIVVHGEEMDVFRAQKEAKIAYMKGKQVAFDLRNSKCRKRKAEIISQLNKS
jgi:hypothetical protein